MNIRGVKREGENGRGRVPNAFEARGLRGVMFWCQRRRNMIPSRTDRRGEYGHCRWKILAGKIHCIAGKDRNNRFSWLRACFSSPIVGCPLKGGSFWIVRKVCVLGGRGGEGARGFGEVSIMSTLGIRIRAKIVSTFIQRHVPWACCAPKLSG